MYMEGKKELFLSTDGIFIIRSDDGEKGLKTEFYKLSSDGWHVEFIESISYKVDDSGQKKIIIEIRMGSIRYLGNYIH